jgi:hypothetical protein
MASLHQGTRLWGSEVFAAFAVFNRMQVLEVKAMASSKGPTSLCGKVLSSSCKNAAGSAFILFTRE